MRGGVIHWRSEYQAVGTTRERDGRFRGIAYSAQTGERNGETFLTFPTQDEAEAVMRLVLGFPEAPK